MAKKKKVKPGGETLVHMSREQAPKRWEDILLLDPTDERIQQMRGHGFVVIGSYRLTRITGGRTDMALPRSGTYADAHSSLCDSPWGNNEQGKD
jgi:hypothetical protein